uniref:Protein kinase domain-containing protein n=1 Tax=Leersia perrieri TaxID=77586 RepID=A0A0D9UW15_9ORYZ
MQLMLGPTRYSYTNIIAMSSHFREKLGHGGFGSVFKGVILPGDVHVAIKMLANYNCTGDEFISEVSTIGSIHHVNVVCLVGFCAEEMRRALVYEYMPNGSLDKFVFSPEKSFSWDKLNEIALGIAKGMNYLHQGCEMQIVHFYIKPHNILLDSKFVPKVHDFGPAKLYPRDNSFVPVSAARGTIGYIARGALSSNWGVRSKSDTYSFGMLLLEMAGGRRNSKESMSSSSQAYYPSWVYNHLVQEEMGETDNSCDMHELEKKLCIVGLHCVQMKPQDRPTMSEVIEMLEGDVDDLQLLSRPFFCDDERDMEMSRDGIGVSLSLAGISMTYVILSAGEVIHTDCSSSSKATIQINTRTYYVTSIDYTTESFWVVDARLHDTDTNSSCPLPRSDHLPSFGGIRGPYGSTELPLQYDAWPLSFVNCSQAVKNNSMYVQVDCLSTSSSFVYVLDDSQYYASLIDNLEPSCGFLAMIPVSVVPFYGTGIVVTDFANCSEYPYYGMDTTVLSGIANYADLVKFMKKGFAVRFPDKPDHRNSFEVIEECLIRSIRGFRKEPFPSTISTQQHIVDIIFSDFTFWACIIGKMGRTSAFVETEYYMMEMLQGERRFYAGFVIQFVMWILKFVLAPLVILIFLAHKYWKTRITIDAVEKFLRMQLMLGPTRYTYTDIIAMTNHFRNKLGQGGYGSVFKGVMLPGDIYVAIKMLTNSCNGEEFISEVSTIGRIHHINVVRLVGFCAEETRALVYEYMPHGSLDKFIFSPDKSFSWDKLNEIALGIARGLNYLHQGCDMQILHFDIKPHNILLDSNFVPKVADFGLAKLCPRDNNYVPVSAARGTIGYIVPEMISRSFGVISSKSDVYSFGMLLLEMAGGRRNSKENMSSSSQAYYPSWVYKHLVQQEMGEIADACDMHELEKKLCIVGLHCIQMKPQDRPTMSEVIEMLEGGVDSLQLPSRPFFCDDEPMPPLVDSYPFSEPTEISEDDY